MGSERHRDHQDKMKMNASGNATVAVEGRRVLKMLMLDARAER